MALQTSGQITHTDIATEFSYPTSNFSLNNDGAVILTSLGDTRTVGSSQVKESDFYGLSAAPPWVSQGFIVGGSMKKDMSYPPDATQGTNYSTLYNTNSYATPADPLSPNIGKAGGEDIPFFGRPVIKHFLNGSNTLSQNFAFPNPHQQGGLTDALAQPMSDKSLYMCFQGLGDNGSGGISDNSGGANHAAEQGPTGMRFSWTPNSGVRTSNSFVLWMRFGSLDPGDYKITFLASTITTNNVSLNQFTRNDGGSINVVNHGLTTTSLASVSQSGTATHGVNMFLAESSNINNRLTLSDTAWSMKEKSDTVGRGWAFSENWGSEDRYKFTVTTTNDYVVGFQPYNDWPDATWIYNMGFIELWKS